MVMVLHAVLNASTPLWRAIPEYSTSEAATAAVITYKYLLQTSILWVAAIVVVLVYGTFSLSRRPKQVLTGTEGA